MTNIDYPVTYICRFKETWEEERSENYHCIDRAAALQQAKEDFQKRQFVDSIEFYDNELKFSFVPDDAIHSSGSISVMFSNDYGWSEHVDNFFDVPLGQIDHADKQTCLRCYTEIARVWKEFDYLKNAFLRFADSENDNIISFIHEYSDTAELTEPIIKKYYGDFDMLDQQIMLWSQMYWGGFFRKDFEKREDKISRKLQKAE